jgi:hypothetical protein
MGGLDDFRRDRCKVRFTDSKEECGEAGDERFILARVATISNS